MSDCVRSGFCCKQGVCPFGTWDHAARQCAHLIGDRPGNYECGIYEDIRQHESAIWSPAFGSGCSSTLNPDRVLLIA